VRSASCGAIFATGVPFLVMTIVSPRSAAEMTWEKFWFASRTVIWRMDLPMFYVAT